MKIISAAAFALCLAALPALAQPAMTDKKPMADAMKGDAMKKDMPATH
jgi:Spy/CpxP family protein refolding chaperone